MEYRHGPISIAAPGRAVWAFGDVPSRAGRRIGATGAASFVHGDRDPLAELVLAQRLAVALRSPAASTPTTRGRSPARSSCPSRR